MFQSDTKSERFGLLLSPAEKSALAQLAQEERLPAAAVVRRLIWHEYEARLKPAQLFIDPFAVSP